jgi:hypothetical protein
MVCSLTAVDRTVDVKKYFIHNRIVCARNPLLPKSVVVSSPGCELRMVNSWFSGQVVLYWRISNEKWLKRIPK